MTCLIMHTRYRRFRVKLNTQARAAFLGTLEEPLTKVINLNNIVCY